MMLAQDENTTIHSRMDASMGGAETHKPQQDKMLGKFINALRQLSEVIDYETQSLASHINPDFNDIKARKARGLQGLTLALEDMERETLEETIKADIQNQLDELQSRLVRNQHLLQTHMEAVGELVEMIHSAADAQETDGTYDPFYLAASVARKQSLQQSLPGDGNHSD